MANVLKIILVALTLILGGCAPEVHDIIIDPECPVEIVEAVVDGVETWEEATGVGYWDSVTINDEGTNFWCSQWVEGRSKTFELDGVEYVRAATTVTYLDGPVDIYINMDHDNSSLDRTVLHELGHALGILGHIDDGNVMSAGKANQSEVLTEADISAALEAMNN